jgi:glucose-1-phosphate thymidylyltransferase
MAVTGLYIYDETLWDKIDTLIPSDRGEYEITDIQNLYLEEGTLRFTIVQGFWIDAGTHDSLLKSSVHVANKKRLDSKKGFV